MSLGDGWEAEREKTLIKVKDMLLQQSIEEQRKRDAEALEQFRKT